MSMTLAFSSKYCCPYSKCSLRAATVAVNSYFNLLWVCFFINDYFHILSLSCNVLTDPVRSDCFELPEAKASLISRRHWPTERRESDLMFIQATGFILDISTSSLVVQCEEYIYADVKVCSVHLIWQRIQCLIWRYHTHLSQGLVPLCGSLSCKNFSLNLKQIPKAFNHLTLVADFFQCSVLFSCSLCWTAPQEFDRRSLLPLHAVCCVNLLLFSSLILYVNGIYVVFLIILFVPVEQLHFHQSGHRDILMELSRCDEWRTG